MSDYYADKLSAERLKRCYEVAPPATRAYLEGEIEFVLTKIAPSQRVLELGCGYGRVLARLAPQARSVWGIDTSAASLRMAREYAGHGPRVRWAVMRAERMAFRPHTFDTVICVQNGISAFKVDHASLVREAVRVTRRGGHVFLSSYAERFWPDRLKWFEAQAAHGLIGEIDHQATRDGVIVCRDGFRATTVGPEDFARLAAEVGILPRIVEVAGSSLFCELQIP
jgi:ubiquinone/menaquinone biosynthesis C-methylase UbiE